MNMDLILKIHLKDVFGKVNAIKLFKKSLNIAVLINSFNKENNKMKIQIILNYKIRSLTIKKCKIISKQSKLIKKEIDYCKFL